jgi:uncharacterized protein (UPF0335 family)
MTDHGPCHNQLTSLVSRIEQLEGEKADIATDIKEVYAEAKSEGYPVKALRALIRERAEDADKRAQLEADKEMLRAALGPLATTPLGEAARP